MKDIYTEIHQKLLLLIVNCLLLFLFILPTTGFGQAATATWALTANSSVSTTGAITANAQTFGAGLGTTGYGANGVYGDGFEAPVCTPSANDYFEFNINSNCLNNLTINGITFTHLSSNGTRCFQLKYSIYNGCAWSAETQIGTDISVTTIAGNYNSGALAISVPQGQSLRFRLYGSTANAGRILYAKNFIVSGTTSVVSAVGTAGTITGSTFVCQNQNGVAFSVPAITNAVCYIWSLPSGATIASGTNTNSITVNFDATATDGNISVYGKSGICSGTTSPNFAVGVMGKPVIITNPVSTYGCNGTPLSFSVVTTGAGLTYQWQEFIVGWSNLSNGGVYSGVTTEVLTISDPTGLNGRQYRCIVTGSCSPAATSTAATLNVLSSGLSGTKIIQNPIGGANYASLKAAFDDINANGLTGNLVLQINSDLTETATASLNQWNNCGNTGYTVTIYPTGATRTISGNIATSLITLNGADNVTFDGRLGGSGAANSLIISNIDAAKTGSTLKFIADACNNTVQYCTLKGVANTGSIGTIWFSTATTTGNDNNRIRNCDIRDGATTPVIGIYAAGTVGMQNDNNAITNCNIYDFYQLGFNSRGISLGAGNTKWTISGNSLYQTSARTDGGFWGIVVINSAAGDEFIIDGNYIGGRAPVCAGAALTITGSTYAISFEGIIIQSNTSGISYIQNNIIRNINFTSFPGSNGAAIFTPIDIYSGRTHVIGNTIGDASTGSIVLTVNSNSTYYAWNNGIYKSGDGNVLNNSIGSITINGSIAYQCGFNAIEITGTLISDLLISGNTIGGPAANSIQTASGATPAVTMGAIYFGTAGNYRTTVSNNTVTNITLGCTGIIPFFIGLNNQATAGTQTIIGNSINNISSASARAGSFSIATDFPVICGIRTNNIAANSILDISANTLHSLSSTHATALVTVFGIHCGTATTGSHVINRNFVHSFSTTNPSSSVWQKGIVLTTGTGTISNNMIRLNGNGINTDNIFAGIENATTSANSVLFNSVYIGGTATGSQNSTAYYRSSTGTTDIRNNIFVNARTGGTGTHYAYFLGVTTNLTSNYNIYSNGGAGVAAMAGVLRTTLAGIQTGTGQDANSFLADPLFVNPTGTASTVDLHINAGSPPVGKGIAGTGITADYDLQQRKTGVNPNGPCIGADENDVPPLATNAYGIYMPASQPTGTIADCEIYATGGTPGGIGYQVVNPLNANYANVGISGYQIITEDNISCMNTNISFTTTDGTPDWLMGNGSNPASGLTTPLITQYTSTGRKDIIESVKVFKDFTHITMDAPSPGTILGAPSGAGCPTTYSYTSSVAGTPGNTYSWSCIVPGGCSATIASPDASTTNITFVNTTGVNQVFILQLNITTECCGPLAVVKRYITIYPSPLAPAIVGGPFSLCTGGSQTVLVNTPDPSYSYEWYSASTLGTLLGSGTTFTVNPVLSGANSYWVQATNSYGCSSPRTEVVITGNDATPPTVANQQTCGAGDVTFVVSAPVAGYTYNWFSGSCGGTLLQSNTSTSYTATIAATTTFYVQAIPIGCGASTCSAPVATLAVAADPLVWLGAVAGVNNWFNTANWTGGCLPTCANNVSIPNTANDPDIGFNAVANAACKNIDLQNGAVLSFSSNNAQLDICGNMTHAGQVTTSSLGIVKFIGTTPQSYSKTGLGDFHNVTLNNTAASPSLTLSNGNLELDNTGTFQFVSGKVITGVQQLVIKNPVVTSVTGHSIDGYVAGNLTRYVNSTGSYDLPLGNINAYELATINISSTTGLTYLTTYFGNPADAFGTGLPATDNTVLFDLLLNAGGINATTGNANGGVWTITPNAGSADYILTLYGRNYDNGGTTHTIVKRITAGPGAWAFAGTFGTNSIGGNLVTAARTAYSGFSQFAIAKSDAALPVKLLSFDANCVNDVANIEWATATEQNNDYFTLERSADASFWDFVANIDGAGNSNAIQHYAYADEFVLSGTTYYRLLQTDFDGRKYLYGPISVNCENATPPSIYYFPNPFTSDLLVNVENLNAEKASIVIYNMLGEIIMKTDVHNINEQNHRFQLDLSHLATGMYTIEFVSEGFENISKVVKYY